MHGPGLRAAVLFAAGALVSACSDPAHPCPPTAPEPAIDVEIREGGTDLPLAARARGVIRDGTYVDSLQPWRRIDTTLISRAAGFERHGMYDVEITLEGYGNWRQTGVAVSPGRCNVQTVTMQATLQPTAR